MECKAEDATMTGPNPAPDNDFERTAREIGVGVFRPSRNKSACSSR
jgi:hypothetical protein